MKTKVKWILVYWMLTILQLAGPGIAIANKRAELIVKLKPVLMNTV